MSRYIRCCDGVAFAYIAGVSIMYEPMCEPTSFAVCAWW